jgi:hypothetical protein
MPTETFMVLLEEFALPAASRFVEKVFSLELAGRLVIKEELPRSGCTGLLVRILGGGNVYKYESISPVLQSHIRAVRKK